MGDFMFKMAGICVFHRNKSGKLTKFEEKFQAIKRKLQELSF